MLEGFIMEKYMKKNKYASPVMTGNIIFTINKK